MTKFHVIWLDGSENFCFRSLNCQVGKQPLIWVSVYIGKAYFYEFFQLVMSKPNK